MVSWILYGEKIMTTERQKQRDQLKGYTQAVQDMSSEIKQILDQSEIAKYFFEQLESKMRLKVLEIVEGQK